MAFFSARTVVASAARTESGNSDAISAPASGAERISLLLDVTAQAGTTPTLEVTVEWSVDGDTWFTLDGGTADGFAEVTTTLVKVIKTFEPRTPFYRIVWEIGGTSPSYTFSVVEQGINQQ